MNAIVKQEFHLPSLQMDETELLEVLESSLYPGASRQSIKMVLGYCRASGLDPMRKPVHIVPMWDNKAKRMRDVTMPGIGLYRTDAARTGEHVGTDEPIFGPMVDYDLSGIKVTVPEWCKVTVYRLKNGLKCAYTATEYWIENYATAGKDSTAPNNMWKKRGRGQLAKCAEAQALRKGFPEVGNQPTADEMEGKTLDMGPAEVVQPPIAPPALIAWPADAFAARLSKWQAAITNGSSHDEIIAFARTKGTLTAEQEAAIRALQPQAAGPTFEQVAQQLREAANEDALNVAADLIGSIASPAHQAELNAIYETRMDEMSA